MRAALRRGNIPRVFAFTDAERARLTEDRALATDAQGREILVGLTFDETVFCVNYEKSRMLGTDNPDDAERYLQLHEKHERARLKVLGAEYELRTLDPSRH